MANHHNFEQMLESVEVQVGRKLNVNHFNLEKAYSDERNQQSLTIKVLSVIGGILATLGFVLFLNLSHLDRSATAMFILSFIFFVASIWMNNRYDKVILDTISVCFYLLAYGMFAMGFFAIHGDADLNFLFFIGFAIISFFISRSYILTFLNVLIVFGSMIAYFEDLHWDNLIHFLFLVIAALCTYFSFQEGKLMKSKLFGGKRFLAIRSGLTFAYMICLFLMNLWSQGEGFWISNLICSAGIILLLMWLIHCLLTRFKCDELGKKIFIYLTVFISLGFTYMAPAISGSLLILLLSFKVYYRTGIALGIIGFVYFVGQYYYDLDLSLLHKSIAMMVSGSIFILLYLLIFKKSNHHEKV